MRAQIFVFALSIVICAKAQAELKWEQTTIELHPTPADKQAIGHFKYQNTGEHHQRIDFEGGHSPATGDHAYVRVLATR
ncbi:MAG: hypothetical protein DMF41_03595 [Verrucomicrobia bacterium]|nr:MAG: hypothetical protein DMF41_03595 [Verrucomicrobiota bacterium]